MKAVLYARYSSDNQREESIDGQLRECKEYAERHGITILSTYIDRAFSAKTDHRPDFQRMINDSTKGLFDAIIVWKLDRFARNRHDSAHYKAFLKKNGVRVISAMESIASDSTGILMESMLEGYAEYYSAERSEKVIRGLKENALKCKSNGGITPIGYIVDENRSYQIAPVMSPIVVEIYQLYADGLSIKQIVDLMNAKGVRTKRNKPVNINHVTRMLHNRRYLGEFRYGDIVRPGGMPAIISQELFDKVQHRLVKNKKAAARYKAEDRYLLSTKLFCGHCGSMITGESGTSHTMKVYHYYKCFGRRKKICHKENVNKDWIENLVIAQTMEMVWDDDLIEYLAELLVKAQKKESTLLPSLKKQLSETEKAIDNILNAIQMGIFTKSTKTRLDQLEESKCNLELAILKEELTKPIINKKEILKFLHHFRNLDMVNMEHRQRLVDTFINAIYLYDDKLIITFNYKESSKTISLDEIKNATDTLGKGSDTNNFVAPNSEAEWLRSFFVISAFSSNTPYPPAGRPPR